MHAGVCRTTMSGVRLGLICLLSLVLLRVPMARGQDSDLNLERWEGERWKQGRGVGACHRRASGNAVLAKLPFYRPADLCCHLHNVAITQQCLASHNCPLLAVGIGTLMMMTGEMAGEEGDDHTSTDIIYLLQVGAGYSYGRRSWVSWWRSWDGVRTVG